MKLRGWSGGVVATADGSTGGSVQSRVGWEAMRNKQVGQCVRGGGGMCDTHLFSSSKGRLNGGREIARG